MIKLCPEVMFMVCSEECTIYSEIFTIFQQAYSAAFSQLQPLIPTRYSSLKTVFVLFRPAATSANALYVLFPSPRVTFGLTDYQFLLESECLSTNKNKRIEIRKL